MKNLFTALALIFLFTGTAVASSVFNPFIENFDFSATDTTVYQGSGAIDVQSEDTTVTTGTTNVLDFGNRIACSESPTGEANCNVDLTTDGVSSAEIDDNSIQAVDLEATNSESDGNLITYDSATGGFTFQTPSSLCVLITGSADLCDGSDDGGGGGGSSVWSLSSTDAYYSAGQVWIGTNAGSALFEVHGGSSSGSMELSSTRSTVGNIVADILSVGQNDAAEDTSYSWAITKITDDTDGSESGSYEVRTMRSGTLASRLFIDSVGYLGIGTSTPATEFHLHDAFGSTADMIFTNSVTGTTASDGLRFRVTSDDVEITNQEPSGLLYLGTGTAGADLTINASGNVGIGTTSPSVPLHVAGGAIQVDSSSRFQFSSGQKYYNYGFYSAATDQKFETYDGASVVTRLYIDASDGNVGIGNEAPSTDLHVTGGARITDLVSCDTIDTDANGVLSCGTDNGGGGGGDEIVDADGDTKIQVEESADEDIIRIDIAGTEIGTWTTAGVNWNVPINLPDGESTPVWLTVSGTMDMPSGTDCTTDAEGEFCIDTTSGQPQFHDGTAERAISTIWHKSFQVKTPTAGHVVRLVGLPYGLTITEIGGYVDPGDSSESVAVEALELDNNGDNALTISGTLTVANTETTDTSHTNASIDSGDGIGFLIGTVTGTVSELQMFVTGYITPD